MGEGRAWGGLGVKERRRKGVQFNRIFENGSFGGYEQGIKTEGAENHSNRRGREEGQ